MRRTSRSYSVVAIVCACLATLSACSSDSTGPGTVLTQNDRAASKALNAHIHKLKGHGRDEFSIDTETGVLSDNRGHARQLDPQSAERIAAGFDFVQKGNAVADAIENNAAYQHCLAAGKANGRKPKPVRVSSSTASTIPAPAGVGAARFNPSFAANIRATEIGAPSTTSSWRVSRIHVPNKVSFTVASEESSDCYSLSTTM